MLCTLPLAIVILGVTQSIPWARQPRSLFTGRDISSYSKIIMCRDNE